MKLWLLVAILGLGACGGAEQQDRTADGPTAASSSAPAPDEDDDVRRGCSSFTQAVANEDSNEVYDPKTRVLQVYVGTQRFLLSAVVEECRENPVAMQRLRFADAEESPRQDGVRHAVYTHCGVISTTVDGILWVAEPPLADGGNAPAGWDENETPGAFRQKDANHAVFVADSGVEAAFTKARPGSSDPGSDCD